MAQIRDTGSSHNAFLAVEMEAGVTEAEKNGAEIPKMLLQARAGHQNVVKIDEDAIQTSKHPIH